MKKKKKLPVDTEPLSAIKSTGINKLLENLKLVIEEKVGQHLANSKIDSVNRLRSNGLTYGINPNMCYVVNCVED